MWDEERMLEERQMQERWDEEEKQRYENMLEEQHYEDMWRNQDEEDKLAGLAQIVDAYVKGELTRESVLEYWGDIDVDFDDFLLKYMGFSA